MADRERIAYFRQTCDLPFGQSPSKVLSYIDQVSGSQPSYFNNVYNLNTLPRFRARKNNDVDNKIGIEQCYYT